MVETGTPCAIILQDDARLEDGFAVIVEEILKADAEWDIVNLAPKRQYRIDRVLAVLDVLEGVHWIVRLADIDVGIVDRRTKKLHGFRTARPGRAKANRTGNTVTHVSGL